MRKARRIDQVLFDARFEDVGAAVMTRFAMSSEILTVIPRRAPNHLPLIVKRPW
jgi:hypothetical protein